MVGRVQGQRRDDGPAPDAFASAAIDPGAASATPVCATTSATASAVRNWKRAGIRFSVQHLLAEPGDISGGAPIAPKSQRASPTTPTLPPRPVGRSRRSVEVLECDLSGNPIVRDDAAFSLEASDPLCIRTIKFEPNADATAILLDEDGA